jgi:hypothetical protein
VEIVVVAPVPVNNTPSGFLVMVHVPAAGKPLKTTLPVDIEQVGCVTAPITGADGEAGCVSINTLPDAGETHPNELVTVKVYVPAARSVMVAADPLPVVTIPPGDRVNVQVPDAGNPLSCTLPFESEHFEGVIVPTKGAEGTGGCGLIIALFEGVEVQKLAVVTVKVYVPGDSPEIVVADPLPEVIVPIGLEVITQLSVGGNPLRATLPVLEVHVG